MIQRLKSCHISSRSQFCGIENKHNISYFICYNYNLSPFVILMWLIYKRNFIMNAPCCALSWRHTKVPLGPNISSIGIVLLKYLIYHDHKKICSLRISKLHSTPFLSHIWTNKLYFDLWMERNVYILNETKTIEVHKA